MVRDPAASDTTSREIAGLVFALVLVLLVGALALRSWSSFGTSVEQQDITRQVVDNTNKLLSALTDAETGQRGFILVGEDRYLEPYQQAVTEIPLTLEALARVDALRGRGEFQRLGELKALVAEKLAELKLTIELRRAKGPDAVLAMIRTGHGKVLMDRIRTVCAENQALSYRLLQRQTEDARASADLAGVVGVLGSAVVFVFLLFASLMVRHGNRARQALMDDLAHAHKQVKESRDWLQTTLSSIGDGVVVTDEKGNVSFLNDVAQALTGWTQQEAHGVQLEELFVITNIGTGATVESPVTKALREGRVVGLANHTKLTSRDGTEVPIDDSAAPIRDESGRLSGVVLVFRDVTERYRQEQELQRSNDALNHFAFAASHDLQEPLRMITSYSQLLLISSPGQLGEQAEMCVRFITEGTKRMQDLLGDLLMYAQVSGEEKQPVESVDLNVVLRKIIENCRTAIDESGAIVTSGGLPVVLGHEAHFLQLFQNLVGNAIKYRAEQPPCVRVSAEKEGSGWRISVVDNGIGIAPEYHQKVFGVFKRLHGQAIPGTGIGLAICQRVVERYGGRIWVESEVGRGATFVFTLP